MRRRRRKYEADPLVPFVHERLQAAVQESGLSVSRLAAVLRVPQPTLHWAVTGKSKRCRRSLLGKLARRLGIDPKWLRGEPDAGPFARRQATLAEQQGTVFETWERDHFFPSLPPMAELRAGTLVEAMMTAWARDLESGAAPEPSENTKIGSVWHKMDEAGRHVWIGAWLEDLLLTPQVYRPFAYSLPERIGAEDVDLLDWLEEKDDSFSISMITVLETLLSPWFNGVRALDYAAAYGFLEVLAVRRNAVIRTVDKGLRRRRIEEWREAQIRARANR